MAVRNLCADMSLMSFTRCWPPFRSDKRIAIASIRTTLFNRVAKDLRVGMKNHWKPDCAFLDRRNRVQLAQIAKECGYAEGRIGVVNYKKSARSPRLFRVCSSTSRTRSRSTRRPKRRKAVEWLPEAMSFPAIIPDEANKH